jgi:hypothetical protein
VWGGRDKDSRRDELRSHNNALKSSNEELIERIEIHEETKLCIDKDMAHQSSVSQNMLLTSETVDARIQALSATHKAEIDTLDEVIRSSAAQLQENEEMTRNFSGCGLQT